MEQQQDPSYYCTVSYKCETCVGAGSHSKEGLNFFHGFCMNCDGTGWLSKKILVRDFLNLNDSKKNKTYGIDYEKML